MLHVNLGHALPTPVSGRLLVFAKLLGPNNKRPVARVLFQPLSLSSSPAVTPCVLDPWLWRHVELRPSITYAKVPFGIAMMA
jgi:hypothetical protein